MPAAATLQPVGFPAYVAAAAAKFKCCTARNILCCCCCCFSACTTQFILFFLAALLQVCNDLLSLLLLLLLLQPLPFGCPLLLAVIIICTSHHLHVPDDNLSWLFFSPFLPKAATGIWPPGDCPAQLSSLSFSRILLLGHVIISNQRGRGHYCSCCLFVFVVSSCKLPLKVLKVLRFSLSLSQAERAEGPAFLLYILIIFILNYARCGLYGWQLTRHSNYTRMSRARGSTSRPRFWVFFGSWALLKMFT